MQLRWTIAVASLLAVSLPGVTSTVSAQSLKGAVAFIDVEESGRSVTVKSKPKPKPKVVNLGDASQVLCRETLKTGTRIKQRRCQTIASWKSELQDQRVRKYLLEM